jgi:hypothetical protein
MRITMNHRAILAILCSMLAPALAMDALAPPAGAQQPQRDRNGMPPVPPTGPARVGARAERLRLTLPVDPVVVVVPDGDAYIDAIARWSVEHRYPVLIDDGTSGARDNIARFIRAFGPERVLLWPGARDHEGSVRQRMEAALHRAWGAGTFQELRGVWTEMKAQPPGVVVACEGDPAWPAALALAAGRGQPIFWADGRLGGVGGVSKLGAYQRFEKQVRDQFNGFGYTWAQVGDDIDAITICMNMPTRVRSDENPDGVLALTDMIGRFEDGRLYAWSGIIFGTEAESAYRAMGALFLQPEKCWLFNGYGSEAPYDGYSVYPAEDVLRKVGRSVQAFNPPRNSVDDWRAATRMPIDAGYVHVNSSGHRGWFDLNPGRAYTSDIPFLEVPALVTFIHSFSAQNPDDRESIARRWLENGAYAFTGAVDEPYLPAFTPPAYLAPGLYTPVPLAVMVRPNSGKPWKVNTIGDPLITFGPIARRTDHIPTLPGSVELETSAKAALSERDYLVGVSGFVMLGRTKDAAQLGKAIMAQDPDALTPELAGVLLPVFYRTGRPDLLTTCYLTMSEEARKDTVIIDMLWKALGAELSTTRAEGILDAMSANVRDSTFIEDITAIANAIRRLRGDAAALAFLTRYERAEGTPEDRVRFIRRQMDRINPKGN